MAQPAAGKLIAVALYRHKGTETTPVNLGIAAELSSFGYFQRGSVKEMITFLARTIVQRTQPGGGRRHTHQLQPACSHHHCPGRYDRTKRAFSMLSSWFRPQASVRPSSRRITIAMYG